MVAELVNGALHLHPRPASRHARASLKLGARLDDPFDNGVNGPGGWFLAIEPELHLGDDVLVPDLAGWRRERMGEYPDAPAIELAPDWVCENPLPRHPPLRPYREARRYGAAGVAFLWLLDPAAGLLEAFALRDGAWVLAGTAQGDEEVRLVPFDATGFPLSALWP